MQLLSEKQQTKYELEKLLRLAKRLKVSDKKLEDKVKEVKNGLDKDR